jgi:hypothetical protein
MEEDDQLEKQTYPQEQLAVSGAPEGADERLDVWFQRSDYSMF